MYFINLVLLNSIVIYRDDLMYQYLSRDIKFIPAILCRYYVTTTNDWAWQMHFLLELKRIITFFTP